MRRPLSDLSAGHGAGREPRRPGRHVASAVGVLVQLGGLASPLSAETVRQTTVLRIAVDTPVVVRATVGHIAVTGWSRPEVEIAIVRDGPPGGSIARVSSRVETRSGQVFVTATQGEGLHDPTVTGSVTIHVPHDQRISEIDLFEGAVTLRGLRRGARVRVSRGSIDAESLGGTVRLESEIGDIRVSRADLSSVGMLRLRTFNGSVSLGFTSVPQNARILALSMGGTIESSIPLTLKEQFGPRFGEAVLGRGEPVVSIDVVRGRIRITSGDS